MQSPHGLCFIGLHKPQIVCSSGIVFSQESHSHTLHSQSVKHLEQSLPHPSTLQGLWPVSLHGHSCPAHFPQKQLAFAQGLQIVVPLAHLSQLPPPQSHGQLTHAAHLSGPAP